MKIETKTIRKIVSAHNKNGGITYNLKQDKDLGGTKNYAVSIYPQHTKLINGAKLKIKDIRDYVDEKIGMLNSANVSLGSWLDKSINKVYLDLSFTIPNRERAIELGKRHNQKAIFDLSSFQEIETGGTGEVLNT